MKKLKKRKILFVTSNRADFGLLSNLIKIVQKNKKFNSLVITLGQHLDKKYGSSINEIRKDKIKKIFKMKKKIKSSKTFHLTNYLSDVILFSNRIISKINPNLIVILGDRFEILGPVIAGYNSNIKIAHIHGGEKTYGSKDDSIRHAISKLSNFHFISHKFF